MTPESTRKAVTSTIAIKANPIAEVLRYRFAMLHLLPGEFSQQAGRFHDQDQYQDSENHRVRELRGDVAFREGLDDSQDIAAQDRPRYGAYPAEYRGDEGLEARHDAHVRLHLRIGKREEQSAYGGQSGAQGEGEG